MHKQWVWIIIGMIVITMATYFNSTNIKETKKSAGGSWIYQETADSYTCSGDWHESMSCSNTHDGNWGTAGTLRHYVNGSVLIYPIYNKPENVISAKWKVKNVAWTGELNIPGQCFLADSSKLSLRVNYTFYYVPSPSSNYIWMNWDCWDGSNWRNLWGYPTINIYEEAVQWEIMDHSSFINFKNEYISGGDFQTFIDSSNAWVN